jgi:hypothetical protein
MKWLLWILAALALIVGIWLGWGRLHPNQPGPRRLTDLEVAERWLHCIDCHGSFLKRLRDMPSHSRDTVTKFLHLALIEGPDSLRAIRRDSDLVRSWRADSISRARIGKPPSASFVEFMDRYRTGFDTRWQIRAAIALGVIRTPAAFSALADAQGIPPVTHGDSLIRSAVERAQADSGLVALKHYVP